MSYAFNDESMNNELEFHWAFVNLSRTIQNKRFDPEL